MFVNIIMFNVNYSLKLAEILKLAIGMQDFGRLVHLSHYLLETEALGGAVVEFGCNEGRTSKLLTALTDRPVHIYDSFMGLPKAEGYDGEMSTSVSTVLHWFDIDDIRHPIIHKGWFDDLVAADVPGEISFAHLDGDMYESTLTALNLVYPRMLKGATMLVDDYLNPNWSGVERALSEFFTDKQEEIINLRGIKQVNSLKALITKL